MGKWLNSKISSLSNVSGYQKPARYSSVLRMDTNENLALPRRFVLQIMLAASRKTDLREYPTEQFDELKMLLSRYLNVPKECIATGSGSDQIIDLLLSTFADEGERTVTISPTFTFYRDRCNLHSIEMKEIKLDYDFSLDPEKVLSSKARICYICSPNNPTGNQFDKQIMLDIIKSFNGLVIVDEAYVEFADYSLKDYVKRYDNLVVLRTMSKAFGLAGARVGYMIASGKIADLFVNTIQYPYPISSFSLKTASLALSSMNYVRSVINKVKRERERVFEEINSIGNVWAFRSNANFILFEAGNRYRTVFRNLIRKGVLVRDIGDIDSHKGCLRVSIGTESMNNKFLKALKVVCQ